MPLVSEARALAESLLATTLPRRWAHVSGVAARAAEVAAAVGGGRRGGDDGGGSDRDVLVAAGWLHDIGYSPGLVGTGFHPLDGARHLRAVGMTERVTCLVAHHSCALIEARLRGLGRVLSQEFAREESPTADALLYCDLTTSPSGVPVTVGERLAEIRERYGPGHVVTAFIDEAEPEILAAVARTEERLRQAAAERRHDADTAGSP